MLALSNLLGIRCGNPPQIPNGKRRVYGHYLHDMTKYQCNVGYKLVGEVLIYCQTDGYWSLHPDCHSKYYIDWFFMQILFWF